MSEKLEGLSMDIEQTEREKLQALFPQCFVDGKLDIDRLLSLCGEYINDDFEKYEFRWKGKTESVNWDATRNVYIEGDNLEVLKLLQTSYFRKVKMIYIEIITSSLIQFKVSSGAVKKRCAKSRRENLLQNVHASHKEEVL